MDQRHVMYQYQPLEPGNIRLLELLPGESHYPLSGRVSPVSLDDSPQFEAVSYVWGDPTGVSTLRIAPSRKFSDKFVSSSPDPESNSDEAIPTEFRHLPITGNLNSALRRLRHTEQVRCLWVDAICINQNDIEERNVQVQLMGEIYRKAARVVAHLGNEENGSEMIPSLLDKIYIYDKSKREKGITKMDFFWDELDMPVDHVVVWDPIRYFFDRPWFRRYWIIQEIALAQKIWLYCGKWELMWGDEFLRPARMLLKAASYSGDVYGWKFRSEEGNRKTVAHLLGLRDNPEFQKSQILLQLAHSFRRHEATDSRDRIYSLLGLCADKNNPGVMVDYSEGTKDSPRDTYVRFAKHWLDNGFGVGLLYAAANSVQQPQLPSWVPNWNDSTYPQVRLVQGITNDPADINRYQDFSANGDSESNIRLIPGSSNLQVDGIIIDNLEQVSRFSPKSRTNKRYWRNDIYAVWKELRSFSKADGPYRGRYSEDEVIWRTMVCDLCGDSWIDTLPEADKKFLRIDHAKFSRSTQSWYMTHGDPEQSKHHFPARESIRRHHEEQFMVDVGEYAGNSLNMMLWKYVAVSEAGYMCQVPLCALPGDRLCVILGAAVPFVLRPQGNSYRLLGECYIHGLMTGEAFKLEHVKTETLTIV